MYWPARPSGPPWRHSVAPSFERHHLTLVRVLFISDVYFPRVNGVSTSIRTFREDLAACGVETVLVAPDYNVGGADEAGVVRIASAGVPRDPEDRRMHWGALIRALDS